jgi:bacteriorhodopsin
MFKDRKMLIYLCNVFAIYILAYSASILISYRYLFFTIAIMVYGYFSFKMIREITNEFEKHENNFVSLFQFLLVVLPLPMVLSIIFR